YYAYQHYSYEPPPPPPPAPKAEPVDFFIKVRVRALLEEWKRRTVGEYLAPAKKGAQSISPPYAVSQIRERLIKSGSFTASALPDVVARCLNELGVPPNEANEVASGILAMKDETPQKKGERESASGGQR
ncbi:MAG: hypothetical protein ACKOJB_06015, partial [Chthoniobacterales bacterium]